MEKTTRQRLLDKYGQEASEQLRAMDAEVDLQEASMTAATLALANFLLARIAEDEGRAKMAQGWQTGSRHEGQPLDWSIHMDRWSPDRVLAECAAKRLVLTLHEDYMGDVRAYRSPRWQEVEDDTNRVDRLKAESRGRVSSDAVQALAQVYADHPEFRDEWRWENR